MQNGQATEYARNLARRHNARSLAGMTLRNANGDIDQTSLGYQITIDTLTYIRKRIVEQKFYQVAPAKYVPMLVGEGAFMQSMLTNLQVSGSGDFEEGIINQGIANDRVAAVSAGVVPVTVPVINWAKALGYSIIEIEQALASMNWDYITGLEKSRKTNYDLGIQMIAFLGSLSTPGVYGLYTQPDVNINTAIITTPISSMNPTEFQTFISTLVEAYRLNANRTQYPNTFVLPESDWNGLADPVSPTYPNVMKIEWLQKALDMVCMQKVTILPSAYGEASQNASRGINKQRYALYNKDEDTIRMDLPVYYTPTAPNTANNFNFQNVAYAQFTGVRAYRPLEVLYFDIT